jgi:hypothetical protein
MGERHARIREDLHSPEGWVFVEIDASRQDKHVTEDFLYLVHLILCNAFPDEKARMREFYDVLRYTRGKHNLGVSYKLPNQDNGPGFGRAAQRCSGDCDTSYGNSMLSLFYIWLLCKRARVHVKSIVFYIEGDDILLACNRLQLAALHPLMTTVGLSIGQELKVKVYYEMSQATFLGRHYYFQEDGSVSSFGQPYRCLEKVHLTTSANARVKGGKFVPLLSKTKLLSLLCLDSHTPIFGVYLREAYKHMSTFDGRLPIHDRELAHKLDLGRGSTIYVDTTEVDRIKYALVTGICPDLQLHIETNIRKSFVSFVPTETYMLPAILYGGDDRRDEWSMVYSSQ